MKSLTCILILTALAACTRKDNKKEILSAKFTQEGGSTTKCLFRMYSDSTYTFDIHEYQEYRHEKNEIFRGRYLLKGDSIVFFPFAFYFLNAETALIKNNYLEFVDGKMPFKMKVLYNDMFEYKGVDSVRYKNYSFFTYDTAFYHQFSEEMTPYDLTNEDLVKIESIMTPCIKDAGLDVALSKYFKQCIAVKNKNDERVVWINFLCDTRDIERLKCFVIYTNDGGDCFFNVKINLDKEACYDLSINGSA